MIKINFIEGMKITTKNKIQRYNDFGKRFFK